MSGETVSYEKRFYEWLSTQVTRSQILGVRSAIEGLNDYCIRKRLLAKPLLETDDVRTLSKIKEKIERSKVFTFVHGRGRKASMINAIHYYIRFTKLDRAKQKEVAENKLTTVESHNIEENMKPQECVTSDSTVGENVTDVVDEDLKQESNLSEIDKLLNEDFYLPLRVALKNEKIVTIQELRDLKLWAFMNRNDIYLISDRREVYEAVQNRLLSLDEDLNGALSGESEKKFSQNDDIILEQLPLEQETQESSTKVDRYTFYHYLLDTVKLSRSTATSYSRTIEECENFARNNNLSTCRLYLTSPTEAASTVHELEQSKDFAEINNLQHHRFSAALAKFSEFIGASSVFAEEQPNKTPVETVRSRQAVQSFDDAAASRVEKLVLDADMDGTTYEQLRDRIGTTLLAVKGIVQTNKSIVEIRGKLYHEKAFVDWEDGAKQLCNIIEKLMQRNDGYITSSQLFDSAHIEMHMFLNDNGLDDEKSVYDFEHYCLKPALEMRGVIKKQLCIIDPKEFDVPGKNTLPEVVYSR
ncbi:MAG: hypothetical protein LUH43_05540 [Clostridia bacterium]|nr:hypothetical protein [Clostridia bacterium]